MRQTTVFDKNWIFYKNPDSGEGENVTLPHTWNAVDGQDGGNDYYRGTCKYACRCEVATETSIVTMWTSKGGMER